MLRPALILCCYIRYVPASLCDICCQDMQSALQVLLDVWQVLLVVVD